MSEGRKDPLTPRERVPVSDPTPPSVFEVYPAIDVLGGQCVRLRLGDYADSTVYDPDVEAVALRWLASGARWIHVVDLDGARDGQSANRDVVARVVEVAVQKGANVQVGGGIRSYDALETWLSLGVSRCILGTVVLDDDFMAGAVRRFGGHRLVAGLDGRDGKLAVRGWTEQTEVSLVDVARHLAEAGVETALVTDVSRDGTLQGANIHLASEIQAQSGMRTLASGGVRDLDDIRAARSAGLAGIVVGKALFDGRIALPEALQEERRL